jgi:hypothetical protein
VKWTEVEARLRRRVAQEFEVQAGRWENGRSHSGSTQAGVRRLKRRKKMWRESSEWRRLRSTGPYMGAEGGREEGEGTRMGRITAYPHHAVQFITGSRHAPPGARVVVAVSESCMLTMRTGGGMSSRGLATPAVYGISTLTKSGLLIRGPGL